MQSHLQSTSFGAAIDEETPPSSSSFPPTKTNFQEPPPSPPPPSLNQPSITKQTAQPSMESSNRGAATHDNVTNNKTSTTNTSNQRFSNQASADVPNSRPSSQLSHTGSSGYGSTRSQVGPFAKDVMGDPAASSAAANRPSPAGSSTSGVSSGTGSAADKPLIPKVGILKSASKRSVWWGGSSMKRIKGERSLSEEARPSSEMGTSEMLRALPAIAGPQFASLRIPNRIRHSTSQGDLPSRVSEESLSEPGIELADAEIDSTAGGELNPELMVIHVTEKINSLSEINGGDDKLSVAVPQAVPRYHSNFEIPTSEQPCYTNLPPYPLRHAGSLESQVSIFTPYL